MKRSVISWAVSFFLAFAPIAVQAGSAPSSGRPTSNKTAVAPKPEQQKLRGVPLWLLLGGLGTAAIILAASNSGKDNQKAPKKPQAP